MNETPRLRISEIFHSIQGESLTAGCPTVFIRLTGCPLRCGYCDTEYAFDGGEWMTLDVILERVHSCETPYVTVTGGEPLAQKNCLPLLRRLCDGGYRVSLETSGALDMSGVDPRVVRVMDLKTPGSGESGRNRYENLALLLPHDQVKFVICSREDYDWAVGMLREHELASRCEVLFSPAFGRQEKVGPGTGREVGPGHATELADWILEDRLPVRLQLQLHKLLWGDAPGK